MATQPGNDGGSYGVHVIVSSVSGRDEETLVIRIKAAGLRDEAVLARAVQSYARSLADLRANQLGARKSTHDMTPWWRK